MANNRPDDMKPVLYASSLTINKDDSMSEKSRYTYLNSTEQSIPIEMETMALADNVRKDEFLKINDFLNPLRSNNFFYYLPTITSTIIYLFTLQGCNLTQFECLAKYPIRVIQYAILAICFAALLYVIQIILFYLKYTNKAPVILMSIIIVFLCFIYDTGTDLDSHGGYNRIFLFLFMIIWLGIISFFYNFGYFLCKKPLITLACITLLIILVFLKVHTTLKYSCEGWEVGFKGTKVLNPSNSDCKIYPPKVCYYRIFNGVFDLSRILGDTCDNMGTNKFSNIEKNIVDKNARILGYPRTEHWDIFPSSTHGRIQKRAMEEMVNMENPNVDQKIKKRIEVTTDFYKNPPQVTIDLKKDENLVKNRRKIFNDYKDKVLAKNILFLFIDSTSRANFKIKLPRLYKWIESFYQVDKTIPKDEKFESLQFLKYHGVGRYTAFNMVPAFFGVYNIYYAGQYFLTDYKNKGYITGQSLNFCGREVFDIDGGAIEKMKWDSYDHELQSFFCDGNFTPYNSPNPIMMGTNSIRKRCMYNKNTTWYSLEYLKQFFTKYKDEPKFFRVGLVDGHEGSDEVIKYSDDLLVEFFEQFKKDGHLDDTLMFIVSDHGSAMPGPYSLLQLEDHEHDAVLPSFFMLLPKTIKNYKTVRETLLHNQNALMTPFTIYNSLLAILNDRENTRFSMQEDYDMFNDKISYKRRNCKSAFYDDIYFSSDKEFLCRCNSN